MQSMHGLYTGLSPSRLRFVSHDKPSVTVQLDLGTKTTLLGLPTKSTTLLGLGKDHGWS